MPQLLTAVTISEITTGATTALTFVLDSAGTVF